MLQRFRDRVGTAGVVIAIIALVAALGGTALAASGALSGKQKKEVEKIAKKFAGVNGTNGTNGTNGSNGAPGERGLQGEPGKNGVDAEAISFTGSKGTCTENQGGLEVKSASATTYVCNGKKGTNGTNGVDAEAVSFTAEEEENGTPAGEPCELRGGIEVTSVNGVNYVCNGSPWAAGGTLPSGATETGFWSFGPYEEGAIAGNIINVPVASFAIPLAAPLLPTHCLTEEPGPPVHVDNRCPIHYINPAGKEVFENGELEEHELTPTQCLGSANAPTALPGNLCVYAGVETNVHAKDGSITRLLNPGLENGVGTTGAYVRFKDEGSGAEGIGTWAVTAP